MYNVRMRPYEGGDNYIFVSYAHKDSDFVLPIIDNLNDLGYRLWFDEGIEASAEWPEYIEQHLNEAAAVLAFVTEDFVESANCRKEITYALNSKKKLLYITPEPVELGRGLSLQLADQQCLDMSKMSSLRFYEKLAETNAIENCRWKTVEGVEIRTHKKRRKKKKKKEKWTTWKVIKTVIISIVVFVAVCILIDGTSGNTDVSLLPSETTHSWVTDASGAEYCETCGVQTGEVEGEQKTLKGNWSSDKVMLNGSDASYYVPNAVVEGCRELTLNIKADEAEGDPYGTYDLYGRDPAGNWKIIDSFDLTEEAATAAQSFRFENDEPIDFTALVIVRRKAEQDIKYNLAYTVTYSRVIIDK